MSQPTQPQRPHSFVTKTLLVVSIVLPVFGTAAVALRVWARNVKSQGLRADDWTIVFSLIIAWAISVNTIIAGGVAGVNTLTIEPLAAASVFLKCIWIEVILWVIDLASIKISILLFYRRIFITKRFKWSVNAMAAVIIGWAISTVLVQIFIADPVSSVWNPRKTKLRINNHQFSVAVASINLLFDVTVLCFPLPMIEALQMPTRRKLIIAGIFWIGAFCCIAASVRLSFICRGIATRANEVNQYDIASKGSIWTHIEPNFSIIAACLPTYGNTLTSKLNILSSLRSFFSLGSRFRPSDKNTSGKKNGSQNPMLENSNRKQHARKAWQILDENVDNNRVEISAQMGNERLREEDDMEAGIEMVRPMRIDVRREIGSQVEVV